MVRAKLRNKASSLLLNNYSHKIQFLTKTHKWERFELIQVIFILMKIYGRYCYKIHLDTKTVEELTTSIADSLATPILKKNFFQRHIRYWKK